MPVTYIGETCKVTSAAAAPAVAVAVAPGAGSLVVGRIGYRGSTAVILNSVTDSKLNSWTIDAVIDNANGHAYVVSTFQDVGKLTTADTITANVSGTPSNGFAAIYDEFAGVVGGCVARSSSSSGASTARASGTTSIVPLGDYLAVACFAMNGTETAWTKNASWSDFTTTFLAAAFGTTASVEGEYQIATATNGPWSATGTGGLSAASVGATAVYGPMVKQKPQFTPIPFMR